MKQTSLAIVVLSVLLWEPIVHADDVALLSADKIPLPKTGVYSYELQLEKYLGYSKNLDALVFAEESSTDGIGGNPDMYYRAYALTSGKQIKSIQADFNLFARADYNGENDAKFAAERKAMKFAAERELAKWGVRNDSMQLDSTFKGLVRDLREPGKAEANDEMSSQNFAQRVYIQDAGSTWIRPLADVHAGVLTATKVFSVKDNSYLILGFERPPVMEFDSSGHRYVVVLPEPYAQIHNEAGFALYKAKNYRMALDRFMVATRIWPQHATALYNSACCAALTKDTLLCSTTLKQLRALADKGNTQARDYLKKVAGDSDFNSVRSNPDFSASYTQLMKGLR